MKKLLLLILGSAIFLVGCPAPSGNYTVVDGQGMTTDTYVSISGGRFVLYEKCIAADGAVRSTPLNEGIMSTVSGGYGYTSTTGGSSGVMQGPMAGGKYSWADYGGGAPPGGIMNPGWPANYPDCP